MDAFRLGPETTKIIVDQEWIISDTGSSHLTLHILPETARVNPTFCDYNLYTHDLTKHSKQFIHPRSSFKRGVQGYFCGSAPTQDAQNHFLECDGMSLVLDHPGRLSSSPRIDPSLDNTTLRIGCAVREQQNSYYLIYAIFQANHLKLWFPENDLYAHFSLQELLNGDRAKVIDGAFYNNGKNLAIARADRSISLYDVRTPEPAYVEKIEREVIRDFDLDKEVDEQEFEDKLEKECERILERNTDILRHGLSGTHTIVIAGTSPLVAMCTISDSEKTYILTANTENIAYFKLGGQSHGEHVLHKIPEGYLGPAVESR